MKSLSIKLSTLFLVFILLLEVGLFFFLYFGIVSERIQTESENLKARGRSHSNVLEKNFEDVTFKHVALMESETETIAVITDKNHEVVASSNPVTAQMSKLITKGRTELHNPQGELLEANWRTEPYLATACPIQQNGSVVGYMYMFLPSDLIRDMIKSLTSQFLFGGIFAIVISMIGVIFLSHSITQPLIRMKQATKKMSTGQHHIELDTDREDELGDLARSIQKLSNDLERMKKDRNEFLSNISHELRTPLTYLNGYANILKRPNLTSEQREEYLTVLQEESVRVTSLVKDLFDLAKLDQNQFMIRTVEVELCSFLHDIAAKMKGVCEHREIKLQLNCEKELLVEVDPQRFEQVLMNLLDNAFKHSKAGSQIELRAANKEDVVEIAVADEGEGIPADELSYIWDRLYRVEKSRSRSTGGSGLGLTIAKEIVEHHGGTIDVTSTLGVGTTFTIQLKGEQ
ncbi:HAMP domain-containing sensor histidine kinase [Bacillus tianshenii]|nr:HAMP domain-containing sensor histidine kinase [Bacillus tianshenii]